MAIEQLVDEARQVVKEKLDKGEIKRSLRFVETYFYNKINTLIAKKFATETDEQKNKMCAYAKKMHKLGNEITNSLVVKGKRKASKLPQLKPATNP